MSEENKSEVERAIKGFAGVVISMTMDSIKKEETVGEKDFTTAGGKLIEVIKKQAVEIERRWILDWIEAKRGVTRDMRTTHRNQLLDEIKDLINGKDEVIEAINTKR